MPLKDASGQTPPDCLQGGLAAVITVSPVVAHTNDVISITQLGVSLGGTACNIEDGQSFIMYPDGIVANVQQYENGYVINQGQTITCLPAPSGGVVQGCQTVTLTYAVQAGDINKPLNFTTPRGFTSGSVPGTAKQVKFLAVSDGTLIGSGGTLTAGGQGNAAVTVVTPAISITKACVNNCTTIGNPISFGGTVCNTGDILLTQVTLSDAPAATFQFGMVISNSAPVRPFANGGVLFPNECVNYTGTYTPSGNLCGPFTDTVTVTATDTSSAAGFVPKSITNSASATCHVQTSPSITLTKDCQPRTITIGQGSQTYTETFVVCNNGNVALVGVVINDSKVGPIAIGTLAAGQCVTNVQGPFTVTQADCPSVTDRAVATGTNSCPADAVCPSPRTVSSAEQTCTVDVICPPNIEVIKLVACYLPGDTCGTYGKVATGVKDSSCPAFCYRITVTNAGAITITALTVNDTLLGDISADFASALPLIPGEAVTVEFKANTLCQNTHNVVTANGRTAEGLADVDTDSADAVVLNINLVCDLTLFSSFDMDENPNNNSVVLPAGSTNTSIEFNLVLRNTGTSPLTVTNISGLPALVDCTDLVTPVTPVLPFDLGPGEEATLSACVLVSCPGAQFNVQAHGVASDEGGTLCVFDENGNRVSDSTAVCPAIVTCETPVTCRVTGGGQLIPGFVDQSCIEVNTTILPFTSPDGLTIKKITHGGQLGAPFSQMDCGVILGNPCIRGQWSHIRHYEGKANPRDVFDMDFHSQTPKGQYDSLSCACLGCCDPATGAFIPPSLGPLIHKYQLCNPDDHKVCGPQPRPSPANAIIWSGIGKVTPTDDVRGSRAAQAEWVVFRVYIEDRSEPGGGHPGGAVEPADIYCFQAWKTGIKVTKKADFSAIATAFREALGQANCDFLAGLESGAFPIGTLPSPTVGGVTADIQDCGPMHDGNHQIHPSTGATCTDTSRSSLPTTNGQ